MSYINTNNFPHAEELHTLSIKIRELRRKFFAETTVQSFVNDVMSMAFNTAKEGNRVLKLDGYVIHFHNVAEARWFEEFVQETFIELGYNIGVIASFPEQKIDLMLSW